MSDALVTPMLITLIVLSATKLAMKIFTRVKKSDCMGVNVEFNTDDSDGVQLP